MVVFRLLKFIHIVDRIDFKPIMQFHQLKFLSGISFNFNSKLLKEHDQMYSSCSVTWLMFIKEQTFV